MAERKAIEHVHIKQRKIIKGMHLMPEYQMELMRQDKFLERCAVPIKKLTMAYYQAKPLSSVLYTSVSEI